MYVLWGWKGGGYICGVWILGGQCQTNQILYKHPSKERNHHVAAVYVSSKLNSFQKERSMTKCERDIALCSSSMQNDLSLTRSFFKACVSVVVSARHSMMAFCRIVSAILGARRYCKSKPTSTICEITWACRLSL